MTNQEKITLLEEMMELDSGTLNEDIALTDIEEWDSMAALSLIVVMDENFNKNCLVLRLRVLSQYKIYLILWNKGSFCIGASLVTYKISGAQI